MRAVFLDSEGLDDLSLSPLKEQCSSLEVFAMTKPEELQLRLAGAEVVIVNKVRLAGELLRATPHPASHRCGGHRHRHHRPRGRCRTRNSHVAWASREARQRIIAQTAENIAAFKAGRPLRMVF
jgi:hypothetical protein